MTIWLIDSRLRGLDGKRRAWTWPDSESEKAYVEAWTIVKAAEAIDSEDYLLYYDEDNLHDASDPEDLETFNAFWNEFGWLLTDWEDELLVGLNDVINMNGQPAKIIP
jgi:hypothetical protein